MDDRTRMNGTKSDYEPVKQDAEETFIYDTTINLSALESTRACQPDAGNRRLARELGNLKLERTYIGSCTSSKTIDFLTFAKLVQGQRVCIATFGRMNKLKKVHQRLHLPGRSCCGCSWTT